MEIWHNSDIKEVKTLYNWHKHLMETSLTCEMERIILKNVSVYFCLIHRPYWDRFIFSLFWICHLRVITPRVWSELSRHVSDRSYYATRLIRVITPRVWSELSCHVSDRSYHATRRIRVITPRVWYESSFYQFSSGGSQPYEILSCLNQQISVYHLCGKKWNNTHGMIFIWLLQFKVKLYIMHS